RRCRLEHRRRQDRAAGDERRHQGDERGEGPALPGDPVPRGRGRRPVRRRCRRPGRAAGGAGPAGPMTMSAPSIERPAAPARPAGVAVLRTRPGATTAVAVPLLLVALAASIVVAVTIGPADLAPAEVWGSIAHHLGLGEAQLSTIRDGIVWELRL